jgi:hypothetical protein
MRNRTWISWIVVACVLMHAVLLGRHHVFMFQAALGSIDAQTVSLADFPADAICHGEAGTSDDGKAKERTPGDPRSSCPVCLGIVAPCIVTPAAATPPSLPNISATVAFLADRSLFFEFSRFRSPPNRGPPPVA